jgi:hypothetical protein
MNFFMDERESQKSKIFLLYRKKLGWIRENI